MQVTLSEKAVYFSAIFVLKSAHDESATLDAKLPLALARVLDA